MTYQEIRRRDLKEWGHDYLLSINPQNSTVKDLKKYLGTYRLEPDLIEDLEIWITCLLALKAVSLDNFGVGSTVVNPEGDMVSWGQNEVFRPYFDSHKHAEMQAMDVFETAHKNIAEMRKYRLYTSVESCPMCLTRLINSGLGAVIHGAADPEGGMVHKIKDLPQTWADLSQKQIYRQARCSPALTNTANKIFKFNLDLLFQRIKER